jgi:hypothetical protein
MRLPVRLRLLPREKTFVDLFNHAAQNALETARAIKDCWTTSATV